MKANIAVNSSGWSVTSKNCSGLRRIFFSARQAMISVWLTISVMVVRGRVRATAAAGSTVRSGPVLADAGPADAGPADAGPAVVMVLTGPPERSRGRRRLRKHRFRLGPGGLPRRRRDR